MENKKQGPRHHQGPDVRAEAFENIPLSQDDDPKPPESSQVPSQPHHVQIISEGFLRHARKSGAFGESEGCVV